MPTRLSTWTDVPVTCCLEPLPHWRLREAPGDPPPPLALLHLGVLVGEEQDPPVPGSRSAPNQVLASLLKQNPCDTELTSPWRKATFHMRSAASPH